MKALTPGYIHLLHGADYNPEQWIDCPEILKKDIELMKEAHINCVSVGIFSWAQLEPREGEFHFEWLQERIDELYKNGIYTVLATPSGSKPVWMSLKYPEIRRVSSSGVRDEQGERHNHCITSPVYREKVKIIDTKLAEHFAGHPGVILWHISNEYGGKCYCPLCREKFRGWLKEKYKTIENLNHEWWTAFWSHSYSSFDEIDPPLSNGEKGTHGLVLDWNRFTTENVADFMSEEINAVKACNPAIPVTTNLMFNFMEYNYSKFSGLLDVVSWDSYPQWHCADDVETAAQFSLWHDRMRSLKGQNFLLMESSPSSMNWTPVSKLKKPRMHMTSSMQAVAHGSNSVQYFQFRKSRGATEKFHGAVVDHYGENGTRVFNDVAEVGAALEKLDKIYMSEIKAEAAVIYDTENYWAIEEEKGPRNCGMNHFESVTEHYRALWEMGAPVDVIDEEDELSKYKIVAAPMLYMLRPGVAEKLRSFVSGGGILVGTYHTGMVNENDLCILGGWPGELMDVFGIWNEEEDALCDGEENAIEYDGDAYKSTDICALIHAQGAEVLGTYGKDFYRGQPALTVNSFGKGKAYYIASRPEEKLLRKLYRRIADEVKLKMALDVMLPYGVTAQMREDGEKKNIFVQNFENKEKDIELGGSYTEMLSGAVVQRLKLAGYETAILEK